MEIEALSIHVYLSMFAKTEHFSKIRLECRIPGHDDTEHSPLVDYDFTPEVLGRAIQASLNFMRFSKPVGEFIFHNGRLSSTYSRLPEEKYMETIEYLMKDQATNSRIVSKVTPKIC